ncbi:hypothetical protein [uncultured Aquimarina sp.]|uniref:NACHT domain-containing protein n=1 Tax=uncultured Aquimarina sp. TaxID=575652 RepID=UPI0026153BD2|nr:hypothetical protein [uncultured Aquimarina sp.]
MINWFKRFFGIDKSVNIKNISNSKVLYINGLIIKSPEELAAIVDFNPIVKSDLIGVDGEKFIGKISLRNDLIKRTFSKEDTSSQLDVIWQIEGVGKELKNVVQENDKVALLGNPGLGKSTELEQLAVELWNDSENPIIPIHKNLRNFTNLDDIDSFIKINWKTLADVIFILDGIDEISDVEDFTSKLETFILKVESTEIRSRFLISCRTNVYEDEVKNIVEFDKFYLEDLTLQQGIKILESKCSIHISESSINENFKVFVKNPYQIEIVAKYIKENNKIPTNTSELWESYIQGRLKDDSRFKFRKRKLNPTIIVLFSKKLSLVNELMKRNTFRDDDLIKITNGDISAYGEFRKNPLFDSKPDDQEKFFVHRNVQEYFASLALVELEFKKITKFICIDGTNKTHPSLFNTITFLINLLSVNSDKFAHLVEWITINEPELLFRADTDRISSNIRNVVFQAYFERECVRKTLWINTKRTYEMDKIGKFADTSENFKYLFEIIQDKVKHFRIRYSALELLEYFKLPLFRAREIQKYFLEELKDDDLEIGIKCKMLDLICAKPILREDRGLIDEVFKIFINESNKQINSSLLHLLEDFENVDEFSEYIHQEFQRANKLLPRNDNDEVIRGNKSRVERLVFKFKLADNFLQAVRHYFNNNIRLRDVNNQIEKISERCIYFIIKDEQSLISLLEEINVELRFHTHRDLLLHIIKNTNKYDLTVTHLINNWELKEILPMVARILRMSNIHLVANKMVEKGMGAREVEGFRNRISNTNSIDLALQFEEIMSTKGIQFTERLFTQKEKDQQENYFFDTIQENLNILFDKELLSERIQMIFSETNNSMDWRDYHKIENEWYEKNGYHNIMVDTPMSLIGTFISENRQPVRYEILSKNLEDNFLRYYQIMKYITDCKERNWEYNLYDHQKTSIIDWCLQEATDFDFDNVIIINEGGKSYYRNGRNNDIKIRTIIFFEDLLKFNLSQEFLVGCIEFDYLVNQEGVGNLEESFDYLRNKINDDEAFKKRIVDNLKNKELFSMTLANHIMYALDHKIEEVYPLIKEYFLNDGLSRHLSARLEQYFKLTDDTNLLLECCKDPESQFYWSAIEILTEFNREQGFCVDRSLEYLHTNNDTFKTNALKTLFLNNKIEAIEYLVSALENGLKIPTIRSYKFANYNVVNDYNIIELLFDLIYDKEFDDFERNDYRSFLTKYLENLVIKGDKEYAMVMQVLNKIKEELKGENKDLYHINILIDEVNYSFYLSKSKPYELNEALKYVNDII